MNTDNDDDLRWLDALAGRAEVESATGREAFALRQALLADERGSQDSGFTSAAAEPLNPRREAGLLDLAAREGLLPTRPSRVYSWQWALAACLVLALGLGAGLQWMQYPVGQSVVRGGEDGVVRMTSTHPAALKQRILHELRAAEVEATGYEALNVHGIDADLPLPLTDAVRDVLRAHDIPEPADGALRIEIRSGE